MTTRIPCVRVGLLLALSAAGCTSAVLPPAQPVVPATVETPRPAPTKVASKADALRDELADSDDERVRHAAAELSAMGTEEAREVLLSAVSTPSDKRLPILLDALGEGYGGVALLDAAERIDATDLEADFFAVKDVLDRVEKLADPRAADALIKLAATHERASVRSRAALCLAQLGDLRAVPLLAERLRHEPGEMYGESPVEAERALAREDRDRIVAARYLADIAVIHPQAREVIRKRAEDAVLAWATDQPQPHANGLRFLAAVASTRGRVQMRGWAFPGAPLPARGQSPPFPGEFAVAQVGLRYLGWMRDTPSFDAFEKQLHRRVAEAGNEDVSMQALMNGGNAMRGMAIRALGVGVADGFAQWGDPRAYPILLKYIENPLENEDARKAACAALGWVTPEGKRAQIADKIVQHAKSFRDANVFLASCYADALDRCPFAEAVPRLLPLLVASTPAELRFRVARIVGRAGLNDTQSQQVLAKLEDETLRDDALIALALGASPSIATQAMQRYAQLEPGWAEKTKPMEERAHCFFSHEDLESGRLDRWAENAEAIATVAVSGRSCEWARRSMHTLSAKFSYDQGPHSISRTVLRYRLLEAARSGDPARAARARRTLSVLGEKGVLMALGRLTP